MKKLKIEETKATQYSTFKTDMTKVGLEEKKYLLGVIQLLYGLNTFENFDVVIPKDIFSPNYFLMI